jgi:hypothetical protein
VTDNTFYYIYYHDVRQWPQDCTWLPYYKGGFSSATAAIEFLCLIEDESVGFILSNVNRYGEVSCFFPSNPTLRYRIFCFRLRGYNVLLNSPWYVGALRKEM